MSKSLPPQPHKLLLCTIQCLKSNSRCSFSGSPLSDIYHWVAICDWIQPSAPFQREEIWQSHLLKVMWVGAGVRGRELRRVTVLGVVRIATEENNWDLYKDKENTW